MTRPTYRERAVTAQAMADALDAELDEKDQRRAARRGTDLDREMGAHLARTTPTPTNGETK